MIRDLVRAGLAVPLLVVAALGVLLGLTVTRVVVPPPPISAARVSVIELPPTPSPQPTPSPTPVPPPPPARGGGGTCPVGCQCSIRPNSLIVICR